MSSNLDASNILPYSRCPKALISSADNTPHTYKGSINPIDKEEWINSISKELNSMNKLEIWDIVGLDPSFKLVGMTWFFKIKRDHLRSIIENESLDIKRAFLNALLAKTVYLEIPQGLNINRRKHFLRLNKAICGLKQAPLAWYERLRTWLQSVWFSLCILDACIFFRGGDNSVWLYVHVDDIAIFGSQVDSFRRELEQEFEIKDLFQANLLLGIKITHSDEFVLLNQQHFTESLLDLYNMSNCKPVSTPLIPNNHLEESNDSKAQEFQALNINYHSAIGCIKYLRTATRPDLSVSLPWVVALFSGKQPTVSLSTAEAEYKALGDLTSELMWLKQWGKKCGLLSLDRPIPIHEDSQSCINAAKSDCNLNNKRMKHIDIQLHFIKEALSNSFVELVYTPTSNMLDDFLTKSVGRVTLLVFCNWEIGGMLKIKI
ncbi:hypothetical protein O181_028786 [Austropuccinia psidii MF-1]|uniref:Reverse transcriptase Ty1/copia-type domain-containing protein n=1 Tax=Austropuccinia psidii MF-1 TaxID=1389203 RepID=A0A9Q3H2Q2_9BASI|nr:hypothetical protein [Austropuccinia psidii MF-1]